MEKKEGYILTEEECIKKGGHVYDRNVFPFGEKRYRSCKYCGHKQKGHIPPVVWEDC